MPNMSMRLRYIQRIARKDRVCSRSLCQEPIKKGDKYMQINEWRQTYQWCWDCWSNKGR